MSGACSMFLHGGFAPAFFFQKNFYKGIKMEIYGAIVYYNDKNSHRDYNKYYPSKHMTITRHKNTLKAQAINQVEVIIIMLKCHHKYTLHDY